MRLLLFSLFLSLVLGFSALSFARGGGGDTGANGSVAIVTCYLGDGDHFHRVQEADIFVGGDFWDSINSWEVQGCAGSGETRCTECLTSLLEGGFALVDGSGCGPFDPYGVPFQVCTYLLVGSGGIADKFSSPY